MRAGGPNDYLLVHLADRALRSTDGLATYFALQRRHPDGRRWVEIAAFVSRDDAEAALERSIKHGAVERAEVRVTKVTREARG